MTTTITPLTRRPVRGRRGLAAAADAIGISVDELRASVHRGDSIARIANDHGVLAEVVVDALVEELRLRLRGEVTAGRVTQASADALLAVSTPGFVSLVSGLDLRGAA